MNLGKYRVSIVTRYVIARAVFLTKSAIIKFTCAQCAKYVDMRIVALTCRFSEPPVHINNFFTVVW
jgi:hypothetical protein